jgi:hypothetical protein
MERKKARNAENEKKNNNERKGKYSIISFRFRSSSEKGKKN